jgi:hypothetical protein
MILTRATSGLGCGFFRTLITGWRRWFVRRQRVAKPT